MKRRKRSRLTLALVILVGTFLVGEVVTRISVTVKGDAPPHADRGLEREWGWAVDHLASGTPMLNGLAGHDADLGWTPLPHLDKWRIHTNALGMRGQREFSTDAAPDTRRLMIAGDSYSFGFNVSDEHAFSEIIARDLLPSWEVMNLAVPGYGPGQALLRYERDGVPFHPDVVVYGFYLRGFSRLTVDFRDYAKPRFDLDDSGALQLHNVPVIAPEALLAEYAEGRRRMGGWSHSYLLGSWLGKFEEASQLRFVSRQAESWRIMEAVLARFRDRVLAEGGRPLLLLIPPRREAYDEHRELERVALEAAADLGLPTLALSGPLFDHWSGAEPPYQPREDGGHFSEEANALVARLLVDALRAEYGELFE